MALTNTATHRALLVDFTFDQTELPIGAIQTTTVETIRLTNWTSDLLVADGLFNTYLSFPRMGIRLPEFTGGFNDRKATLRLANQFGFLRTMTQGRAHSRVTVRIRQLNWDPEDAAVANVLTLWEGQIQSATTNPQGADGLVELSIDRCGGRTDIDINPRCSRRCWKRFGSAACGVDLDTLAEACTITAINGRTLTLQAGVLTAPVPSYWLGGTVVLDGAEIKIRSWNANTPTVMELAELPPRTVIDDLATLGVNARFTPGCDRTVVDCRVYNNEDQFAAYGLVIPEFNPLLERPD